MYHLKLFGKFTKDVLPSMTHIPGKEAEQNRVKNTFPGKVKFLKKNEDKKPFQIIIKKRENYSSHRAQQLRMSALF